MRAAERGQAAVIRANRTAEADLHDRLGRLVSAPNHAAGRNTNTATKHDVRDDRHAQHRTEAVALRRRARRGLR